MAVTNLGDVGQDNGPTAEQSQAEELLVALAEIYTYVKSREFTKSISSFTFDDYINEAKEKIKSDTKKSRLTKLERLSKLEEKVQKVIGQARQGLK